MSCLQIVPTRKKRRVKTEIVLPELKEQHCEHVFIPWQPVMAIHGIMPRNLASIDTDVYLQAPEQNGNGRFLYVYHHTEFGRVR